MIEKNSPHIECYCNQNIISRWFHVTYRSIELFLFQIFYFKWKNIRDFCYVSFSPDYLILTIVEIIVNIIVLDSIEDEDVFFFLVSNNKTEKKKKTITTIRDVCWWCLRLGTNVSVKQCNSNETIFGTQNKGRWRSLIVPSSEWNYFFPGINWNQMIVS